MEFYRVCMSVASLRQNLRPLDASLDTREREVFGGLFNEFDVSRLMPPAGGINLLLLFHAENN